MKLRRLAWLLMMLALSGARPGGVASAAARVAQPEAATSLRAWAQSNGFNVRIQGDTVTLTKGATSLLFRNSSREAVVNGIQVWLLFPIALRGGVPQISDLDARRTLDPILSPPRLRTGATIRTVCLDPGHGGKDSGTRLGFKLEKRYTLLLAQELRDQLVASGFKVILTRTSDKYVDLEERPALARRRGADLFLSLHYNSAGLGEKTVRGAEVYSLTPAGAPSTNTRSRAADETRYPGNAFDSRSMRLAYELQRALVHDLGVVDRGVHRSRFVVLRDATMPAALIEPGFLSHPVEGMKIFDGSYRHEIARAVTRGILAYSKSVQPGV